jgi:hypothetical protein
MDDDAAIAIESFPRVNIIVGPPTEMCGYQVSNTGWTHSVSTTNRWAIRNKEAHPVYFIRCSFFNQPSDSSSSRFIDSILFYLMSMCSS